MQANRRRKFKAPRLLKGKDKARDSDSDGDNMPFSELREKVREERQGVDCEEDNIRLSERETKDATPSKGKYKGIKLLSEREADETAMFGEVLRWSDDDGKEEVPITTLLDSPTKRAVENVEPVLETTNKKNRNARRSTANMVGTKVSRDFGRKGIFHGEVIAVEYDSEDQDKVEPIYVVEYTDGDKEDFDAEQLRYDQDLFYKVVLANDEGCNISSGSDEEESYRPPKVGQSSFYTFIHSFIYSFHCTERKKA
jgi:hypothetical protein